jgi:cytochrome c peroxidase
MKNHRLTFRHRGCIPLLALLISSAFLLGACHAGPIAASRKEYRGTALVVRLYFKPLPEQMPGSQSDTPEMVELGRKLFFERGISLNKSQSCNDCHRLDEHQAGVDNHPTSKGAKGLSGKRNSPTVLNAGFQAAQFWDGRSADLVAQAKGPLLNPIEMAMRTEEDVANLLKSREDYRSGFARAFPDQAIPVTFDNAVRAIAAFERTLITPSRFDRYLKGETEFLTRAERRGLKRFVNTGCFACHSSHSIGGRLLRQFGIYHPYENKADTGRYEVTGRETDRLVFKVPMLRNVTLTAPYFHDGRVSTLPEAVRLMAWMQLDTVLSPAEVDEIVRFLHALEAEHPLDVSPP